VVVGEKRIGGRFLFGRGGGGEGGEPRGKGVAVVIIKRKGKGGAYPNRGKRDKRGEEKVSTGSGKEEEDGGSQGILN